MRISERDLFPLQECKVCAVTSGREEGLYRSAGIVSVLGLLGSLARVLLARG